MSIWRSGEGSPSSTMRTRLTDSPTLSLRPSKNSTARRAWRMPRQFGHPVQPRLQLVATQSEPECPVTRSDHPIEGQRPAEVEYGPGQRGDHNAIDRRHILGLQWCTVHLDQRAPPGPVRPIAGDVDPAEVALPNRQPVYHGGRGMADHCTVAELRGRCPHQLPMGGLGRELFRAGHRVRAAADPAERAGAELPSQVAVVDAAITQVCGEPDLVAHGLQPRALATGGARGGGPICG